MCPLCTIPSIPSSIQWYCWQDHEIELHVQLTEWHRFWQIVHCIAECLPTFRHFGRLVSCGHRALAGTVKDMLLSTSPLKGVALKTFKGSTIRKPWLFSSSNSTTSVHVFYMVVPTILLQHTTCGQVWHIFLFKKSTNVFLIKKKPFKEMNPTPETVIKQIKPLLCTSYIPRPSVGALVVPNGLCFLGATMSRTSTRLLLPITGLCCD